MRLPNRRDTFHGKLLHADSDLLVLAQEAYPSGPLTVDGVEVMAAGYQVIWFLFNGAPYDIGRFYRPGGTWTGYYVDILEPVRWNDGDPHSLEPIVDLFLDLWIQPDGSYLVLDEDELEEAARSGAISPSQEAHARESLTTVLQELEAGRFPPAIVRDWRR